MMKTALMEYQWLCLLRISEPNSKIKSQILEIYTKEKQKNQKNEKDGKQENSNYDKIAEILEILMT